MWYIPEERPGDLIKTRTIQIVTVALLLLFLLAGFARTLLSPDTEIFYENRPANRFPAFSASSFLDGTWQSDVEDAFSDQIPAAIRMKKLYNIFDTGTALPVIRMLGQGGGYVGFRNICFFEDMLVVRPVALPEKEDTFLAAARHIGSWQDAAPGTEFYVYYIETDRDLNLETGAKSGLYDCLAGALALPAERVGRLRVDSFADYRRLFFKTDHHWNADGSYQGYLDLCALLGITPLTTRGQYRVPACYHGTRAAGVEGVPAEDFAVNLYDYPDMTVTIPSGPIPDYGMQSLFVSGELESVSYGSIFGVDCGELVFDTGRPGKTLLVMGDSYDNAIAKPLASCFSKSFFVDLRSYEAEVGHPFDMESYLSDNGIDVVLFVGAIDYFGGTLPLSKGG